AIPAQVCKLAGDESFSRCLGLKRASQSRQAMAGMIGEFSDCAARPASILPALLCDGLESRCGGRWKQIDRLGPSEVVADRPDVPLHEKKGVQIGFIVRGLPAPIVPGERNPPGIELLEQMGRSAAIREDQDCPV